LIDVVRADTEETGPDVNRLADLEPYFQMLAKLHSRLCPRQVLGVRMGIYAGELLGLELPSEDRRLLSIVETDGCFADGISVATGCWLGRRSLRLVDYGKVAVIAIDLHSERAVRLRPDPRARARAARYAPTAPSRWHAQLAGYQRMPIEELVSAHSVRLLTPVAALVGQAGHRIDCAECGEEVLDLRYTDVGTRTLCRRCAGQPYYVESGSSTSLPPSTRSASTTPLAA
jgi:formylmethanofuran dehydrogenase subunit E